MRNMKSLYKKSDILELRKEGLTFKEIAKELGCSPSYAHKVATEDTVKSELTYREFAVFVAEEIFAEEWNSNAFRERACRQLNKLGMTRAVNGRWEYVGTDY